MGLCGTEERCLQKVDKSSEESSKAASLGKSWRKVHEVHGKLLMTIRDLGASGESESVRMMDDDGQPLGQQGN